MTQHQSRTPALPCRHCRLTAAGTMGATEAPTAARVAANGHPQLAGDHNRARKQNNRLCPRHVVHRGVFNRLLANLGDCVRSQIKSYVKQQRRAIRDLQDELRVCFVLVARGTHRMWFLTECMACFAYLKDGQRAWRAKKEDIQERHKQQRAMVCR